MCGIGGIFNRSVNDIVDPQDLVNMAAIQYHRGPDGYGYELSKDKSLGFCHVRLSIIDLNNVRAKQPFIGGKEDNILMVHNGEFYDFQRIRADLISRGVKFSSKSDSEILLRLYESFGILDSLPSLRGEFAFSIYDSMEDCLYLVRDRFGIKPLYWVETDESLIFGSELKVLFANEKVKRQFSSEGLFHQLMQLMVPGTTAFEGINQVKPGYILKVKRKQNKFLITEEKYWDINFPKNNFYERDKGEDYYIESIRKELLKAVELRMVADVPVGCYLSGGIDSCSILGVASAISQNRLKAFTIGFDDSRYDETSIAKEMANSTKADHEILQLNSNDLYENFEEVIWFTERSIYNTLAVAKYLMSNKVRDLNYKVVMTGEGSDELFGGYPAFKKDMFQHGLTHITLNESEGFQNDLENNNDIFRGSMLANEEIRDPSFDKNIGFTPSCLQPWIACSSSAKRLLSKKLEKFISNYDPCKAILDKLDLEQIIDRHPLDKVQYIWIKTMLEGQILTWGGDRVDMANSMEARPPFLDHHLAEAAFSVPPELRIKGNTEKYVLREAMSGLLPESLYKREKFPFMAPPAHVDSKYLSGMKTIIYKYLSEEKIKEYGILDEIEVKKILDEFLSPDTKSSRKVQLDAIINHLLCVQILYKIFILGDIPAKAKNMANDLGWKVSFANIKKN